MSTSKRNADDIEQSSDPISDGQTTKEQTLHTEDNRRLPNEKKAKVKERIEIILKMAEVNFLVATIIVGVTFSAVIQVPGGYNENGKAVLSKNKDFKNFLRYNLGAFIFSLVSMFVHFCVAPVAVRFGRRKGPRYALFCLTLTDCSLFYFAGAFFWAIKAVWTEGLDSLYKPEFNAANLILGLAAVIGMIIFLIINKRILVA